MSRIQKILDNSFLVGLCLLATLLAANLFAPIEYLYLSDLNVLWAMFYTLILVIISHDISSNSSILKKLKERAISLWIALNLLLYIGLFILGILNSASIKIYRLPEFEQVFNQTKVQENVVVTHILVNSDYETIIYTTSQKHKKIKETAKIKDQFLVGDTLELIYSERFEEIIQLNFDNAHFEIHLSDE